MQKVELKPKKNGRVGQFLRELSEIVIAGGPYYIQPLCSVCYQPRKRALLQLRELLTACLLYTSPSPRDS